MEEGEHYGAPIEYEMSSAFSSAHADLKRSESSARAAKMKNSSNKNKNALLLWSRLWWYLREFHQGSKTKNSSNKKNTNLLWS
jgi:hypothetical protein